VSYLAIISGVVVLLVVLATPFIVEWETSHTLERYGATDIAPQLIEQRLNELGFARFVSAVLSGIVIIAGILIWRRRAIGNPILALASALIVAQNVWLFVTTAQVGGKIGAIVRGGWWLFVLVFSVVKGKKNGASWWAA